MTAGVTKRSTGTKLLLLNALVGGSAGAAASFCNTMCMRYAEIEKGIDVCEDEELTKRLGISKVCAKSAVIETSMSRSAMSAFSVAIPTSIILSLSMIGISPQGFVMKSILETACIGVALRIGLPLSVSIFPPISEKDTSGEMEEEFKKYKSVYFSKGL